MKTYFFVPATRIHKLASIKQLGVDEIIIDFEDAILADDRGSLLKKVKELPDLKQYWYRVPLHDDQAQTTLDLNFLKNFLDIGVQQLVAPKLMSADEYRQLSDLLEAYREVQLILLIEHPRLLIELPQILQNQQIGKSILGLGIGSHDLMTFMGSEHSPEQIYFPRLQALYLAKAYGKEAFDIASMNISDQKHFEEELLFGLEYGFDSKFLIHPRQFEWLAGYDALQQKQVAWARRVVAALPEGAKNKDIEPFVLDGQVIEKPHVEKAYEILNKYSDEK